MSDPLTWDDLTPHLHGTASLATVTPRGAAHVAIVTPAVVGDRLWIGSYRSAQKATNVAATPSVALVWSTDAEVYVWGSARLVDDLDIKRSMWGSAWSYDPAIFFGSADSEEYVLIEVTPERAMTMAFTEQGPSQRRWRA